MDANVWAEINLGAIQHNASVVREALLPGTGIIAVLKANAYGHGLVQVAEALQDQVDMFAVTSIDEAHTLRGAGMQKAILNLSYTAEREVEEAINKKITLTVYDLDSAKMVHEIAAACKRPLHVHIKIDTGMHRLGIVHEEALNVVPQIIQMPYLRVEGIYSHFADEEDERFTQAQFANMQNVLFNLQQAGHIVPAAHMAKSGTVFASKQYHLDAVRPGIALYGYSPDGHDLVPALTLKSVIAQMKQIPKGARVGYMQTYTAPRDMKIGIVPIGYAHGYDRGISNRGYMLVDGWRCPVIGRICMSQTIIDLSPVRARITIGEEVVAIGTQKKHQVSVTQVAEWADSIKHEIVSRIPQSVSRVYVS